MYNFPVANPEVMHWYYSKQENSFPHNHFNHKFRYSSAKEALNIGRRFWSVVMEKGFVLYQSPELILPAHQE
ncbi:hypothetical protein ABIB50_002630 [Mucilaginibacter sp. UYCu711]